MGFRRDIQGLRAIAVLTVLVSHANLVLQGGFVGVDIFFVISGYLITGHINEEIRQDRFRLADFYQRRILRIMPALMAMILTVMITGYVFLVPLEYADLSRSAGAALLSVSNILFWNDAGYFTDEAALKPLLHTWSLGVEEQFYIVIPLLMLVLARWRKSAIPAAILIVSAASLAISVFQVQTDLRSAFYLLPARLWELGLGSLLAVAGGRLPPSRSSAEVAAAMGLLLIGIAVVCYDGRTPFPGLAALPPCIGTALIIWAGQGGVQPAVNRMLSWTPAVFVGTISYSLYLWHWPIFVFARLHDLMHGPWRIVWVVAALVLAVASWLLVERPAQGLRGKLAPSRTFALAGGAVLTLLVGCAAVWGMRGFDDRLSPMEAHLQQFLAYDTEANYGYGDCLIGREHPLSVYNPEHCLGRPSKVLLVGDSFGAQLLPGVRRLYGEPRQATASGCRFLLHLYDRGAASCASVLGRVLSPTFDMTGIETVIIGGRWIEADIPDIRATVLEIRRRGVRVVIVGVMPEYADPRARTLLASLMSGREAEPSPFMERQWTRDEAIRRAVSGIQGVTFVSAMEHFCSKTRCRQMIGGDPVTWDTGHITAAASISLLEESLR